MNLNEFSVPLMLRQATAADFEFTHELTRLNMEAYVARHWGPWSRDIYTENYNRGHNFVLWALDIRVGYLRITPHPPVLILDDLQVASAHQRRGFGTFILTQLDRFLPHFQCTRIRLRVFHDNPARQLYLRAGFHVAERSHDTCVLERAQVRFDV